MTSKHYEIADLLMDRFPDYQATYSTKNELYRAVFKALFLNFRIKNDEPYGLYLTHMGFEFLSERARSYDIVMPEDYKIRMADKISLDKMCILPYYYKVDNGITLFLFEEELATIMKLADGNIIQAQEILYGEKKFLK